MERPTPRRAPRARSGTSCATGGSTIGPRGGPAGLPTGAARSYVTGSRPSGPIGSLVCGGVSERPKEHASKACEGATPPWVQIPPPPPNAQGRAGGRRTVLLKALRRLPAALVTIVLLPVIAADYFRPSTGREYGVGLPTKLLILAKMVRNNIRIESASNFISHVLMAARIL